MDRRNLSVQSGFRTHATIVTSRLDHLRTARTAPHRSSLFEILVNTVSGSDVTTSTTQPYGCSVKYGKAAKKAMNDLPGAHVATDADVVGGLSSPVLVLVADSKATLNALRGVLGP